MLEPLAEVLSLRAFEGKPLPAGADRLAADPIAARIVRYFADATVWIEVSCCRGRHQWRQDDNYALTPPA